MGAVALNITHYWTAHEYWTAKFMEESGLPFFYCYSCSHCFRCCILNWHWNGLLMCVSVKQKRIMFSYVTLNFASVLRAVCVPKDSVKVNLVKLVHCHWSQTAFIFLLQRQFWLNYYIFVYWLLLWYVRYGSLPQISLHLGSKNKLKIILFQIGQTHSPTNAEMKHYFCCWNVQQQQNSFYIYINFYLFISAPFH